MTFPGRWKIPVIRIRDTDGGTDQYGDPIPGTPVRTCLPAALFAPTPTSEPVAAGVAATITNPTVYWPGEWPDVRASDRLEINGQEWRVEGMPASWPMGMQVTLTGAHSTRGMP